MAIEFDRDFDGYFMSDHGNHGQAVTYTPSGGVAVSIKAIMNEEYFDIDNGAVAVEGFQPVATCKTTDVPNAAHDDTIVTAAYKNLDGTTIKASATYKVINVQKDNKGITQLLLEEQ